MKKSLVLGSIVAGLLAAGQSPVAIADEHMATGGDYECQGGNMCKGKGACHSATYSCAGNNQCKGKGFVMAKSKEECKQLTDKVKAAQSSKKSKTS